MVVGGGAVGSDNRSYYTHAIQRDVWFYSWYMCTCRDQIFKLAWFDSERVNPPSNEDIWCHICMQGLACVTHITFFQPVSLNDMRITRLHTSALCSHSQRCPYTKIKAWFGRLLLLQWLVNTQQCFEFLLSSTSFWLLRIKKKSEDLKGAYLINPKEKVLSLASVLWFLY